MTIKNSGHDYKGRSSAPGSLALWTYNVQPTLKLTKNFVPDGCSTAVGDGVTMGAGQAFLGLFQFAEANNITIVGGSSETVGAAGGVSTALFTSYPTWQLKTLFHILIEDVLFEKVLVISYITLFRFWP